MKTQHNPALEVTRETVRDAIRAWVLEREPSAVEDSGVSELFRAEFADMYRRLATLPDAKVSGGITGSVSEIRDRAKVRADAIEKHPGELDLYFRVPAENCLTHGALCAHLAKAFPKREVRDDVIGIALRDPRDESLILVNYSQGGKDVYFTVHSA